MEYTSTPVSVTVGDKEFTRTYQQIVKKSLTVDDMLKLLSDEKLAQGVINDWHYGQDLKAKSEVRNAILAEVAGPEKSLEKLIKDFMKAREAVGKPISEERARVIMKAQQEAE